MTTLKWQPEKIDGNYLPDELKYELQKRFYGSIYEQVLAEEDLSYLEGLRDADVDGAKELIKAIYKHGRIVLNEQDD